MQTIDKLQPTLIGGQSDVGNTESQQVKWGVNTFDVSQNTSSEIQFSADGTCYPKHDLIGSNVAKAPGPIKSTSRLTQHSNSRTNSTKHDITDSVNVSPQQVNSQKDQHITETPKLASVQQVEYKTHCMGCSRRPESEGDNYHFKQCAGCQSVNYCSLTCQKGHWSNHKAICLAIQDLEAKQLKSIGIFDHFSSKQKSKVVKLVGNKCLIRCSLENKLTDCLWDTGAMVSLLSKNWIQKNLPEVEIREVRELLDEYPGLDLTAANGSKIPFMGWAEVNMELTGGILLKVPFLVIKGDLEQPLVGYNVVETVISEQPGNQTITNMFPSLGNEGATKLINAIQTRSEDVAQVKTTNREIQIAAGETINIKCKADAGCFDKLTPMVFEPNENQPWPVGLTINECLINMPTGVTTRVKIPVVNESKHTITISGKLEIGRLTTVLSVTPLPVNLVTSQEQTKDSEEHLRHTFKDTDKSPETETFCQPDEDKLKKIISQLDLKHLTKEQQQKSGKTGEGRMEIIFSRRQRHRSYSRTNEH